MVKDRQPDEGPYARQAMKASAVDVFQVVADPSRRQILKLLSKDSLTINSLAGNFDMSRPAVSKHVRVLERAGLVTRGRDAQRRPVRLEAAPLKAATDWLETYRVIWEGRMDALDAHLRRRRKK